MAEKTASQHLTLQHPLSSRCPEKHVMDANYADDLGVLNDSEDGLQEPTDKILKHGRKAGKYVKVKTKVMSINKNINQQPFPEHVNLNVKIDRETLKQVTSFVYLGSIIICNGLIDPELSKRIGKTLDVFNSLNKIWCNQNILLKTKIWISESSVLTILLYATENCQTNKLQIHHMEVFHQSCLRRILRVKSFFNHVRNSETLQRTNQSQIRLFVAIRCLRWF